MLNPFFKLKTITLLVICLILFFYSFVEAGHWKHGIFWTAFLLINIISFTVTYIPYKFKNPLGSSIDCLICFILCLCFYIDFCKIGGVSISKGFGLMLVSGYGVFMLGSNICVLIDKRDRKSSDKSY